MALPDDSLGVVVSRRSTASNAVTDAHRRRGAAHAARRARRASRFPLSPLAAPLPRAQAIALMGRYMKGDNGVDLEEYDGRLYLTPVQGGIARRAAGRSSVERLISSSTTSSRTAHSRRPARRTDRSCSARTR